MRLSRSLAYWAWLFVLLLYVATQATETRVTSLGGTGFFIKDNTNIFFFPATILEYQNQVVGELRFPGANNTYTIGSHLQLGNGVLGVYLNNPTWVNPPSNELGHWSNVELTRKLDVFYGFKTSSLNWGFRLSLLFDRYDSGGDNAEKESAHYLAFSAGISKENLDAGFLLELPKLHWELNQASDDWSGFGMGLYGRYFYDLNSTIQLIPVGTFYLSPTSIEYNPGISGVETTTQDLSHTKFSLGVGIKYLLNKKNFFILGTEILGYEKTKMKEQSNEGSLSYLTFPAFYAGLETWLSSWLIARVGATQVYRKETLSYKFEGSESSSDTYTSGFKMYFGLAVALRHFRLDFAINERLFFAGPNFISGTQEPLSNRISLIYNF